MQEKKRTGKGKMVGIGNKTSKIGKLDIDSRENGDRGVKR